MPARDPVAAAAVVPTSLTNSNADGVARSKAGPVSEPDPGPAAVSAVTADAAGRETEEAEEKVESGGAVLPRSPLEGAGEPVASALGTEMAAAGDDGDAPPRPPLRRR